MPKDLFADDDEEVERKPDKITARRGSADSKTPAPATIRVNESYATKYDQVKRKQELQRLSSKYANVQTASSSDEEGDDEEESDDDEDGSEDDDARFLNDDNELQFAKLFYKIRTNPDEVARDKETRYFAPVEGTAEPQQKKEFRLKDEYQRRLNKLAAGAEDEAGEEEATSAPPPEERSRKLKPRTQEEKQLRDAFLAATKATVDEFDVKLVSRGPKPAPQEVKMQSTNLLHDAFRAAGATEDEKFLEKFFVEQLWRKDGSEGDSDGEYDWEAAAKEEADEIFYDEAERWEKEFQERMYRHEDGEEALTVQTFPRVQEGQLRRKSTSRKETRERREARKNEEVNRQVEELKRLKTLKRKEIEEQRALIARVAGIKDLAKVGITREFLEKDFDPAEFDKAMSAMFDHEYDNGADDDEVGLFADENDDVPDEEIAGSAVDPDEAAAAADSNVDATLFGDTLEESLAAVRPAGQAQGKKSEQQQRFLADDDLALLYPEEALRELEDLAPSPGTAGGAPRAAAVEPGDLKRGLDEKVSEYWKLHYHKIAGDVRTRFRYREVNPETFGLTDEDVLTKDDRQLNMIAPMNCYAAFLGANENKKDRYKALHRRKTLREISSERTSRKYGNVQKTAILNADLPEDEGQQVAARIAEGTKRLRGPDTGDEPQRRQAAHKGRRMEGQDHTTASTQSHPEHHRTAATKDTTLSTELARPDRAAAGHAASKHRGGAK